MRDEIVCVGCGGAVEDDRQGYVKPVCHGCCPLLQPLLTPPNPVIERELTGFKVLLEDGGFDRLPLQEGLRLQIDKWTEITRRKLCEFIQTLGPAEPGHVWFVSLVHETGPAGITMWFTAVQRKLTPIEELDGAVPRFAEGEIAVKA